MDHSLPTMSKFICLQHLRSKAIGKFRHPHTHIFYTDDTVFGGCLSYDSSYRKHFQALPETPQGKEYGHNHKFPERPFVHDRHSP
jgi:hypothetical protein